jgi:hypothetical protein
VCACHFATCAGWFGWSAELSSAKGARSLRVHGALADTHAVRLARERSRDCTGGCACNRRVRCGCGCGCVRNRSLTCPRHVFVVSHTLSPSLFPPPLSPHADLLHCHCQHCCREHACVAHGHMFRFLFIRLTSTHTATSLAHTLSGWDLPPYHSLYEPFIIRALLGGPNMPAHLSLPCLGLHPHACVLVSQSISIDQIARRVTRASRGYTNNCRGRESHGCKVPSHPLPLSLCAQLHSHPSHPFPSPLCTSCRRAWAQRVLHAFPLPLVGRLHLSECVLSLGSGVAHAALSGVLHCSVRRSG